MRDLHFLKFRELKKIWLFLKLTVVMLLVTAMQISAQQQVSGTVIEGTSGEVLGGVTIQIVGTTLGVLSEADGTYSIDVPEGSNTLSFSFVGYLTQEIKINGQSVIDVAMSEDLQALDEIIVTGYGTQQKVSLTGSVSTVNTQEIRSVPTPNLTQSLEGKTTGLFIKTQNSQPGDYSGTSYNIRGYGDALIIIDGMPATNEEFQSLDRNDIAQINILKDAATAAVYGARAGNGVILVTTRRGNEGAPKYNYSFNYGLQQFTMMPGHVNSTQLAQYENISRANTGMAPKWSQEEIDKFKAGNDPNYPSTDWWDLTLRKSAPQTQHNLTISGGTAQTKYFISGGYMHQEGMYRSGDLHNRRFNLRSNIDVALSEKLSIGLDLSALQNNVIGPTWNMGTSSHTGGHWGIMMMLWRSRPQYPESFPDPTKAVGMGGDDPNPRSPTEIDYVGWTANNSFTGDMKFNVSYKLPFGFSIKGLFDYKKYDQKEKSKEKLGPVYYMTEDTEGNINYVEYLTYNSYNRILEDYTRSSQFNMQGILNWYGEFGDHKMDALLAYERLSSEGTWTQAQRIRYEYDLDYLFAGPDLDKSNNGTGWEDGRIGQIFTFNYNYKEKYLVGISARRDGSPKFPEDTRWGIFPSVSFGWRISQENFMKSLPFISNLKLRLSAGRLGYDATGNFQYLATYSIMPASLMVNGLVNSSIRTDDVPNPNITWEKITTYNAGLDFGLLNGKLNGAFDLFYRYRSDVLGTRQTALPDIVGASLPPENIEEYSNRGAEFELSYNGRAGSINYQVGGNVSFSREKIEYVSQPTYATEEVRRRSDRIGKWSDQRWGYMTDGVFLTQEEIDNWAIMDGKNNAQMNIGDIRIIDYNGDGIITTEDQTIIGRGTSPDITFAVNGNINWKGLGLSMVWQGAALYDVSYGDFDYAVPFAGGNAPLLEMYKYSFTPENDWGVPALIERYPIYPKYYAEGSGMPSGQFTTVLSSDFFMRPGAYLRLKNLELYYDIPHSVTNRVKISNLRVYFSGYNLLTLTEIKFRDPESAGAAGFMTSLIYPMMKTYSFGLVAEF